MPSSPFLSKPRKVTWKHPFYDYFRQLRVFCKQASKDEVPLAGRLHTAGGAAIVEFPLCGPCMLNNVGEVGKTWRFELLGGDLEIFKHISIICVYIHIYIYVHIPFVFILFYQFRWLVAGLIISIGPLKQVLFCLLAYHWFVSINCCCIYTFPLSIPPVVKYILHWVKERHSKNTLWKYHALAFICRSHNTKVHTFEYVWYLLILSLVKALRLLIIHTPVLKIKFLSCCKQSKSLFDHLFHMFTLFTCFQYVHIYKVVPHS